MTKILDLDGLTHYDTLLKDYINTVILENDQRKHPIGSLEFNVSGTNPNAYLGFGTWELWGSGKVPVGVDTTQTEFNTVEKTGGAKTASTNYTPAGTNTGGAIDGHVLTTNEIPSHNHDKGTMNITGTFGITTRYSAADMASRTGGAFSFTNQGIPAMYTTGGDVGGYVSFNAKDSWTGSTSSVGGGEAHNHGFTNPTFTGTQATITESTVQPYITCYMWKRVS